MPPWTLPVGAALEAASAVAFLVVGRAFIRRAKGSDAALTFGLFATWWCGVAAYAFTDAALGLWTTFVGPDLAIVVFLRTLSVVFLAAGLSGLVGYVSLVYTHSRTTLGLVFAYYCGVVALFTTRLALGVPVGVMQGPWFVEVEFANPSSTISRAAVVVPFVVPPLIAMLAYLALLRRAQEPTQRWRIVLVSTGILVWLVGGGLTHVVGDELTQLLARAVVGVAVAAAVLAAYHPPASAARRWGLVPLAEVRPKEALDDAARARIRALV